MFKIKSLSGLFIMTLVLSFGFIFVYNVDANASKKYPRVIINAENGWCGVFIGHNLVTEKDTSFAQCTAAGKSGNVNCTCHAQLEACLLEDADLASAIVGDGFGCKIKDLDAEGYPCFFWTDDTHGVVTPSGNVNISCKKAFDYEPEDDIL